jgi:hypothetical protein
MLFESGLAEAIFGGFTNEQAQTAISVTSELPQDLDFALSLAGLFTAFTTEEAIARTAVLKLSRNQLKQIRFLMDNRGRLLKEDMSLAELKMLLAEPYYEDLHDLQKAIQLGLNKNIEPLKRLTARIKALGKVELRPRPLLNGHELMELGAVEGPMVGHLAKELYIAQLSAEVHSREHARQWVRNWLLMHKNGTG